MLEQLALDLWPQGFAGLGFRKFREHGSHLNMGPLRKDKQSIQQTECLLFVAFEF